MPGLREKAVLEIDLEDSDGNTHTGVFELQEDLNDSGAVNKTFLLSNRGQYIREAFDIGTDLIPDDIANADLENRRGYHVDGGSGEYTERLTAKAGDQDAQWGDGSTDPNDPADISKFDATGCDPIVQKQIFEWYSLQAKTDSMGQARLHIGEWTDDSYTAESGVFGKPLTVAIRETEVTLDPDDPSALDVTLEGVWTAVFPEAVVEEALDIIDEIAELMPEY